MRKIETPRPPIADKLHDAIARIEAESGGRLGVALHDTGTGHRFAYRGNERFAMCSTFKLLLAGAVLARVQQRAERLDRRLPVSGSDVIGHAPFTAKRAGGTATVAELCRAMTVESDNGAANLMLAAIGGPAGLTRFLRQTGDTVTRLDRTEPSLNEATPGDPRDTTTPLAMLGSAERLWLGPALAPTSRAQLTAWAIECRTGLARLRAGLPKGWRAGDKTGTGDRGTYNDVAIFWPPRRKPVLITSYLSESELGTDAGNAIHAKVARTLVAMI
ncbi:MAG: class A beta-lactamase [Sphingomonas bacterium]